MGEPAPVRQGGGVGQEHQVAPGHEGRGQPSLGDLDGALRRQGRLADGAEAPDVDQVILAKPIRPGREASDNLLPHAVPRRELGGVALSVVEAHRLHPPKAVQRPRQADAGILAAREQDEGALGWRGLAHLRRFPSGRSAGKPGGP